MTASEGAPGKTYWNPVLARNFPDPFVLPYRGRFYAYATGNLTGAPGFQAAESPDLVSWTYRGIVFVPPWSNEQLWAPEVVRRGGRLYMTYSARNRATGKRDLAIAAASAPLGPFEHRAVLVPGDEDALGVIDATVFVDSDRTPYLIYCAQQPCRIVLRRLRPDLLGVEGATVGLIRPDREWENGVTEAPTMILRDGVYHLIYSGGCFQGTKENCRYAVGHASSRSLLGPYVKTPEPILASRPPHVYGPGHQSLVRLRGDRWWMLYHGWDDEGEPNYGSSARGRQMYIDPLAWHGGTPVVEGPSTEPRPAPRL